MRVECRLRQGIGKDVRVARGGPARSLSGVGWLFSSDHSVIFEVLDANAARNERSLHTGVSIFFLIDCHQKCIENH